MELQIEFSHEDRSRYVRALYAFEANDNTQLTINPGDILEVFYRDDSGWWDGKNVSSNNDGYFPGNYTENLGDNLDIIKQQLLFEEEEEEEAKAEQRNENNNKKFNNNYNIINNNNNDTRSSIISSKSMKDFSNNSIDIRNAEPLSKRFSKCLKTDFHLCTVHYRALCIYVPFCFFCQSKQKQLDFKYDAYIFRSLSTIQHTLCIFGAVSMNHFISSLVNDVYNKEDNVDWINHNDEYGKTVFIRFIITITLSIVYILFLFLTSNTALMFLKEHKKNKKSTNKRDRNIRQRRNIILCLRNISLKCGKCGIASCRPYTFIYTQFLMLLSSYILAFLWQDLCLDFQSMYIMDNISTDWYKNIIFIIILLLISFCSIFLLKRKLNSVYHIYRYYSKQCRDNINNYNLQNIINHKQKEKEESNINPDIKIHPLPKSIIPVPKKSINEINAINNNNNKHINGDDDHDISRPYQVSLYLYFWCLLSEITLFMFALPLGSCFAAFCFWLLSSTKLWNVRITRIVTMIFYIITFIIIYIWAWRTIHIAMHTKRKKKKRKLNNDNTQLMINNSNNRLSISTVTTTTTTTHNELLETQSNLTNLTLSGLIQDEDLDLDEDVMVEDYETDIPDFIIMILMKYYGEEIEKTEFKILSTILMAIFFCDIFLIGFWFNLWMLFDNDTDPFNNMDNDDNGVDYDKYLNPSTQYLLYVSLLTLLLPFICSYLFSKNFRYFCCRRNNYKLSIFLEKDKLWMKSLLSRWFIFTNSLVCGYLWCEYFEVLWFKHNPLDTKYYTLTTGLWAIIIYIVIFIVIIIFKLNQKILRLLWTMHDEDSFYEDYSTEIFNKKINLKKKNLKNQSGVGNLGLNASVKSKELEKKLGRRMISYNTQKAKKAIINEEIEIIKNNKNHVDNNSINNVNNNNNANKLKRKNNNTMPTSGLSASLLADDDDDAQIL